MIAKLSSSTSDTHLSDPGSDRVCACGRVHPRPRRYSERRPSPIVGHRELVNEVYEAQHDGNAVWSGLEGRWYIDYAGDCLNPVSMVTHATDRGHLFARRYLRCRKCAKCKRAKMYYWIYAMQNQMRLTHEAGLRTWFGTLTLDEFHQRRLLELARQKYMEHHSSSGVPDWWDEAHCDERFRLVRDELVLEIQRFWKRLRKAGHRFKYCLAVEQHKSGLPHVHFLLHEVEAPILKRQIADQWPFGFTQVKLVNMDATRNGGDINKVAFYVAKYITKTDQSRQLASRLYRPQSRKAGTHDLDRREAKRNVKGGPEGGFVPILSHKSDATTTTDSLTKDRCDSTYAGGIKPLVC